VHEIVLRGRSRWFAAQEEDVADDLLVGLYHRYVKELTGKVPMPDRQAKDLPDPFLRPMRPQF
jgi:hypothetical protein